MNKKKIIFSLMLAGVVLSAVNPSVSLAEESKNYNKNLTQSANKENSVLNNSKSFELFKTVVPAIESSHIPKAAAEDSAFSYIDNSGVHTLPIPKGSSVTMYSTDTTLYITYGVQTFSLTGVVELKLKNIIVSNLIPFYSDTIVKMTLDSVDFRNGIDISGTTNLQEVDVKDSIFGATDYSFAIHSSAKLTKLNIDNSSFNADIRIYDNANLQSGQISNSTMQDDILQYNNKAGYFTDFSNNKFNYVANRTISSGGMSNHDIFYINANGQAIGATKFDASKSGQISSTDSSGSVQNLIIPVGESIKSIDDSGTSIQVTLSNGQTTIFNDVVDFSLNNADIATPISFVSNVLKLTKLTVTNSRTQLIDVAYSQTLENIEIFGTEISQSTGYLSIYNNSVLKNLTIQDTSVNGLSGYISVYNNNILSDFVLNNVYSYGYLSAYNLGGSIIKISNSKFDDYINTNQIIEGEGAYIPTGEAPVINATDKVINVNDTFDPLEGVTASDAEDGDLTSAVKIKSNDVNTSLPGVYYVTFKVTDSDGNITKKTITVTVKSNTKPVINATDKVINVNDTFDPLEGVTASDAEDGDLTSAIEVVENGVDVTTPGAYEVKYSVTDSDGNTTQKTVSVIVESNTKSVINATDKVINVNDTFDPLEGVTASDAEDGDLTSAIELVENNVDVTSSGAYEVKYSVTDSDGNTTQKTVTVTVKSNTDPAINATDKVISVNDTFDPLEGVTASDAEDGDLTSAIELVENNVDVTSSGAYEVKYSVTDSDGNTTQKTVSVIVE